MKIAYLMVILTLSLWKQFLCLLKIASWIWLANLVCLTVEFIWKEHIYFLNPTNLNSARLQIEETVLKGSISATGSAVHCKKNADLVMINTTFNMTRISQEGGFTHHSSTVQSIVHTENLIIDASAVNRQTIIMSTNAKKMVTLKLLNFFVQICSVTSFTRVYTCQEGCFRGSYTFQASKMTIQGKYPDKH